MGEDPFYSSPTLILKHQISVPHPPLAPTSSSQSAPCLPVHRQLQGYEPYQFPWFDDSIVTRCSITHSPSWLITSNNSNRYNSRFEMPKHRDCLTHRGAVLASNRTTGITRYHHHGT